MFNKTQIPEKSLNSGKYFFSNIKICYIFVSLSPNLFLLFTLGKPILLANQAWHI